MQVACKHYLATSLFESPRAQHSEKFSTYLALSVPSANSNGSLQTLEQTNHFRSGAVVRLCASHLVSFGSIPLSSNAEDIENGIHYIPAWPLAQEYRKNNTFSCCIVGFGI